MVRIIADQIRASFFLINGPEVMSKYYGESESKLKQIFSEAKKQRPSIVFIDELDAICPKRESEGSSEFEKRIVSTLLTLLDGMEESEGVILIGATNRPNAIDSSLRRPGRLDREIEIGVPNEKGRREILKVFLSRMKHRLSEEEVSSVAKETHGYVGADLQSLCKEAALKALRRYNMCDNKCENSLCVLLIDLKDSLKQVRPSALREISIEVPNVRWEDIGGQEEVKERMREAVEWPLKYPHVFERMNVSVPKGILLFGPPGCSKTLTAKCLATESGLNFIAVKGPELLSKWVGESEKAVHSLFMKARQAAPSIVFFDEIDAIGAKRGSESEGSSVTSRVLSQLLTELDGVESLSNVLFVAATNRPDMLDKALLRPGRIDRMVYVGPPDCQSRKQILSIHLRGVPLAEDVDLEIVAKMCEGYSGAEVASVCTNASLNAIRENKEATHVCQRHLFDSVLSTKSRITNSMIEFYKSFMESHSQLERI